jgi:hypothetical protein
LTLLIKHEPICSPLFFVNNYPQNESEPQVISHTGLVLVNNCYSDHEHPEVFPQPSQTKHEPAIRIFTPQVMHRGASDLTPLIFSKSSIEEPTPLPASGALSIFTCTGAFATGLKDADCAAAAATISLIPDGFKESGVYSPVSSARWRSDDV